MDTEQARAILAAEDAHARSLANLRNAAAMSTDDPRATELLEQAGDAYAASTLKLADLQGDLLADVRRDQLAAMTEDPAASSTEATVVHDAGGSAAKLKPVASAPEPTPAAPKSRPEGGNTATPPAGPQTPAGGRDPRDPGQTA